MKEVLIDFGVNVSDKEDTQGMIYKEGEYAFYINHEQELFFNLTELGNLPEEYAIKYNCTKYSELTTDQFETVYKIFNNASAS